MFWSHPDAAAAYAAGRASSESAQIQARFQREIQDRFSGRRGASSAGAENEVEHLQQVIADKDRFISELSAYADRLEASFNRYREWGEAAKRDSDRFQEWGRDNARDNARLREIIEGLERRLAVYEPPQ